MTTSTPKSDEGTWLWLIKLVTGILIIFILLTHFIVNHLSGSFAGGLLSYQQILAYYQNPLVVLMEAAFVTFAVSHSLIGLRSIVLDLNPKRGTLQIVNWVFLLVGAGAILYGWWLLSTVAAAGRGL